LISDSSEYTEYLRNTVKKVKVLPIKNNNGDTLAKLSDEFED